jgi:hypothetical protein
MLVLKALLEPMQGYGVVVRIEQIREFPVHARLMLLPSAFAQGWTDQERWSQGGLVTQSLRNPTTTTSHCPTCRRGECLAEEIWSLAQPGVCLRARVSPTCTGGRVSMDLGQIVFIMSATKTSVRIR